MSDSNLSNQDNEIKLDSFLTLPINEILKSMTLSDIKISSDRDGSVRDVELRYICESYKNVGLF